MSEELKVGDYVTWRTSPNAMGITGCRIIRFLDVVDEDNKLTAGVLLDCGMFGEAVVALEHVHKE